VDHQSEEQATEFTSALTAIRVCSLSTLVRTQTLHVNVLKGNIAGLENDGVPEGRVGDRDTVNGDVFASSDCQRNWSSKDSTAASSHSGATLGFPRMSRREVSWQSSKKLVATYRVAYAFHQTCPEPSIPPSPCRVTFSPLRYQAVVAFC
jgi:hypothetical protein